MSKIDDSTGRDPHSPRRYIRCALAAAVIALGTSALSPASAAALSTFDRVSAFVDSTGFCANGAQTVQNLGSASVPDINCSNASFSATTSALSEFGALHGFADLRFTGFDTGPQAQFAYFEAQARAEYFDTLQFGPGAATWEVTLGASGQSVLIRNGNAFDENVGWCFNLFGAVCSSGTVLANLGTYTFSVPIPANGILSINPSLLIDLQPQIQLDAPNNFEMYVDLSHTVQFLGSRVLDANGEPIIGATISSDSGFNYVVPSVPEASSFAYMALGLAGVMFARGRVGRWRTA